MTCLVSGWLWCTRTSPDARVRSIIGWWPKISASNFLCFLCSDCAWCRLEPSVSEEADGKCSRIHPSSASSSNPNLWNRSDSSNASLRLRAGLSKEVNLKQFSDYLILVTRIFLLQTKCNKTSKFYKYTSFLIWIRTYIIFLNWKLLLKTI